MNKCESYTRNPPHLENDSSELSKFGENIFDILGVLLPAVRA